jgi:hypothetical protein
MNFETDSHIEGFRRRIADFVECEVVALESDRVSYDGHGNITLDLLGAFRPRRGRKACGAYNYSPPPAEQVSAF